MTATRAPSSFEPYAPSGQRGHAWALPLLGLAFAATTALAYGWITANSLCLGQAFRLVPLWLLFRLALLLGFAQATARLAVLSGRLLQVRRVDTMRVHGVTTALLAVWLSWVVFVWSIASRTDPLAAPPWTWLQSPADVWDAMQFLAASGVHSIRIGQETYTPTGAGLWVPWAIEAAVVVVFCVRAAPRQIRTHAFCEGCRRWMRSERALHFAADASPRDVRRHGLAVLQHVEPPQRDAANWLRIDRQRCPRCNTASVFRVDQVLRFTVDARLPGLQHVLHIWYAYIAPLLGSYQIQDAEPVVPLSWQRDDEQSVLQRIEAALAQHPLSRIARR